MSFEDPTAAARNPSPTGARGTFHSNALKDLATGGGPVPDDLRPDLNTRFPSRTLADDGVAIIQRIKELIHEKQWQSILDLSERIVGEFLRNSRSATFDGIITENKPELLAGLTNAFFIAQINLLGDRALESFKIAYNAEDGDLSVYELLTVAYKYRTLSNPGLREANTILTFQSYLKKIVEAPGAGISPLQSLTCKYAVDGIQFLLLERKEQLTRTDLFGHITLLQQALPLFKESEISGGRSQVLASVNCFSRILAREHKSPLETCRVLARETIRQVNFAELRGAKARFTKLVNETSSLAKEPQVPLVYFEPFLRTVTALTAAYIDSNRYLQIEEWFAATEFVQLAESILKKSLPRIDYPDAEPFIRDWLKFYDDMSAIENQQMKDLCCDLEISKQKVQVRKMFPFANTAVAAKNLAHAHVKVARRLLERKKYEQAFEAFDEAHVSVANGTAGEQKLALEWEAASLLVTSNGRNFCAIDSGGHTRELMNHWRDTADDLLDTHKKNEIWNQAFQFLLESESMGSSNPIGDCLSIAVLCLTLPHGRGNYGSQPLRLAQQKMTEIIDQHSSICHPDLLNWVKRTVKLVDTAIARYP